MQSPNVNDKMMALRSIERVIQLCGQNIRSDGWSVIIVNIGMATEIQASDSSSGPGNKP